MHLVGRVKPERGCPLASPQDLQYNLLLRGYNVWPTAVALCLWNSLSSDCKEMKDTSHFVELRDLLMRPRIVS